MSNCVVGGVCETVMKIQGYHSHRYSNERNMDRVMKCGAISLYSDPELVNYHDFMCWCIVTDQVNHLELLGRSRYIVVSVTDLDCYQWSWDHLSGSSWPVLNRDS